MDSYLVWSIGLLLLGLALLALEFVVPSAGVISLLSLLSFVGALFFGFREGPTTGLVILVVEGVTVPAFLYAAIKLWPTSPIGRLVLNPPPEDENELLPQGEAYHRRSYKGQYGVAKTDLLPAGAIEIQGRTLEAIAQGPAIDRSTPVKVVAVEGNRLIVRAVEAPPEPALPEHDPDDILSQPIESLDIEPLDDPLH